MKRWMKLNASFLVFVLLLSVADMSNLAKRADAAISDDMRDLKASELVADMGLGWNLGNTLDSHGVFGKKSDYQLVGFYMDGTNNTWNMSTAVPCYKNDAATSVSATLTWAMNQIASTDSSKPSTLGFQIWNFSKDVTNGTLLPLKVTKAELTTGGKTYSFPGLLGNHTVTVKDSVASFQTNAFDSTLTKSSDFKAGTFTLTVEITPKVMISKEEYFETIWGNPVTTKALIDEVKAAGFRAVRVPATWFMFMDSNNNIDTVWMNRVEEIVNYVLDSGMYCILNVHHDTGHKGDSGSGWLSAETSNQTANERFASLWKQVATNFKDYNDYLLFEGFNEILTQDANGNDIWGYPGTTAITAVNELNQLFIDTVRATGSNNTKRHLVVNTYAAASSQTVINDFVLPKDSIQDHLIVEVHDYSPMEFAWTDVTWTAMRDTWGTTADKAALDNLFDRLDNRFVSKGIPVIIGEFGTCNKNNSSERAEHAAYFVASAKKKGITCFWWDNGGFFEVADGAIYEGSGLMNRRTLKWEFPTVVDALVNAAYGTIEISPPIIPKKAIITSAESSKTTTAMIKWSKCSGATGYQILYSTNKTGTFKSAGTTSNQSFTIRKLTKGKTYYIRIRAYVIVDNIKYYGSYSLAKAIKIK